MHPAPEAAPSRPWKACSSRRGPSRRGTNAEWTTHPGERGGRGFWEAIRASKDPTTATVLLEDFAALADLFVALVGVGLGQAIGSPYPDAIASLFIGLI